MTHTERLAAFLGELAYADLPASVVTRTEELFLDWLGSALASDGSHPIPLFHAYAQNMGPTEGRARVLVAPYGTSAYFAALVNGAASHLVEQDDLHNSSVLHPATVVFSAALAAAQDLGKSGQELILAAVAGYEAGIRIGEFLGRSHYRIFHTTATVGTLAAAVAVGKLLDFDREQFIQVLGNAGTQAAGLWEFLRDAADSKQLHTAKAAADGLLGNGELAAAVVWPDQRVLLSGRAKEFAIVDPLGLDELELAGDVRADKGEHNATICAVILQNALGQRRAVAGAAPEHAVQAHLADNGRIARMHPPDV